MPKPCRDRRGQLRALQILLSECATLRWLESVDIPTPRLHGYGLRGESQNDVGVAYMLIDELPGRPFNSLKATESQKDKVLAQWAKLLSKLASKPLDALGSLTFGEGESIYIGPVASDRTGTLPCIGPFKEATDFYRSWAEAYLGLISDSQLFSRYPLDAYLMFKNLEDEVLQGSLTKKWNHLNKGPFFLKHTDDKGDHILIDDQYNITGVIDWTFARSAPAYEAFSPSLLSANNSQLFRGQPGLSSDDKTLEGQLQQNGAPYVFYKSDEMRRFLFGLGMGLNLNKKETREVFQGLSVTLWGSNIKDWDEWQQKNLRRWPEDERLLALAQGSSPVTELQHGQVPRFASCSFTHCSRPSVRGRSCSSCSRHLCAIHITRQHHTCLSANQVDDETWERGINAEVEALLALINVPELVRISSSLRGGLACKFSPGKHLGRGSMMGCANYHAWIEFDDGQKWLARIPRTTGFDDIPTKLVEYSVESEFATLKWLEGCSFPTPRAYGFGLASDPTNLVGVSYILEEAMPGQPFYAHQANAEQRRRVYDKYANMLIEISQRPTSTACSLSYRGHQFIEDAISSNRFLVLDKHGPYLSPNDYFSCTSGLHLDLIADGQLYPEYAKEAFLYYTLLRDRATPMLAESSTLASNGFFLKHVDDKGDHILVDKDFNITAIIDWQFARFVPACEAFGPSLLTADLSNLYNGVEGLSEDDRLLASMFGDKGRQDLAELASGSELARRFQFGLATGLYKTDVLKMIRAILSLLDGRDESPEEISSERVESAWARASGDPRYEKLSKLVTDCYT